MKKWIIWLLVLSFALALAGCSGSPCARAPAGRFQGVSEKVSEKIFRKTGLFGSPYRPISVERRERVEYGSAPGMAG